MLSLFVLAYVFPSMRLTSFNATRCNSVGVFWGYQKEVYKARSSSGALTTAGGVSRRSAAKLHTCVLTSVNLKSYLQGQLEAVDPVNSIFTVTWITGIGCEPLVSRRNIQHIINR